MNELERLDELTSNSNINEENSINEANTIYASKNIIDKIKLGDTVIDPKTNKEIDSIYLALNNSYILFDEGSITKSITIISKDVLTNEKAEIRLSKSELKALKKFINKIM